MMWNLTCQSEDRYFCVKNICKPAKSNPKPAWEINYPQHCLLASWYHSLLHLKLKLNVHSTDTTSSACLLASVSASSTVTPINQIHRDSKSTEPQTKNKSPKISMDQAPIKIGQYVLGKNLGIGAFGKVSESHLLVCLMPCGDGP